MGRLIWNRIEEEWKTDAKPGGYTYRAKVPGGWLVSVWAGSEKEQKWGGGLTFIHDPDYTWFKQVNEI